MPIVLSRLDPAHVRTAVELAGAGVWFADAGGGWTLVRPEGEPVDQDTFSYSLARSLAELDPDTPAVLLWDADPDSGYVLLHAGRSDSHVWGVADPDAAHGDVRRVARAVGDPAVAERLRPLLQPVPEQIGAGPVREFAAAIGATAPVVGRAVGGSPTGEEFLPRTVGCHGVGVAGPLPDPPRLAQALSGGRWVPSALLALAVLFGLAVVTEIVVLAAGRGSALDALGVVLFGVLALLCTAVVLGLRKRIR